MYYALTEIGKIPAERGLFGTCPTCGSEVIPKCGEINIHHWAHKSLAECDTWSEGETDWHLQWKSWFPPECTEITMTKDGETHRADVKLSSGWVLEFQHSPISIDEILVRNAFWGKVIWIFDMTDIVQPWQFDWARHWGEKPPGFEYTPKEGYDTFLWRHARRSIFSLQNFVLDFGVTVFMVKRLYPDVSPVRGWGYYRNKAFFLTNTLHVEREWSKAGVDKVFNWTTLELDGVDQ